MTTAEAAPIVAEREKEDNLDEGIDRISRHVIPCSL
jgi:hypothetical protein